MNFPIPLEFQVNKSNNNLPRKIALNSGLTVLVGPNGSGKTHLMRALKNSFLGHNNQFLAGKTARFLSAGRIGPLEYFRSDYDGRRGGPLYDQESYGGKNESSSRKNSESLTGDFHTLAARQDILIKVSERLRKLFHRGISIEWDMGKLRLKFLHEETGQDYSSAREASGLLHLVGLLAALYDDEVGTLLIDEPEVSLHPQLQAFLLNEIVNVAGLPTQGTYKKIIVISTHSTEFINLNSIDDLPNFVFCEDLDKEPIQIESGNDILKSKQLGNLVSRMGQTHKLALFAKTPLLVEGPSDSIICSGLANKLDLNIEACGSQLLPVIGKGEFPSVVNLMRLIGKNAIVLADADAYTENNELCNIFLNSEVANERAKQLVHKSAMSLEGTVRNEFTELVDTSWDEIKPLAEQTQYMKNISEKDKVDPRRAAFSAIFQNESDKLPSKKWKDLRSHLKTLLELLEFCGCFILRRGTIEDYFRSPYTASEFRKPHFAVVEVNSFEKYEESEIEDRYSDIIRCIEAATQSPKINEAELVRDHLLSLASVAIEYLKSGKTANEINTTLRSVIGERAELFQIDIVDSKLKIDIQSNVLKVDGFPIFIGSDTNVNVEIPKTLGLTE